MAADDSADDDATDSPEPSDPSTRVFTSAAARRAAILRVGVLGVALAGSTLLVTSVAPELTDPAWLRTHLDEFGPLAPVAFVALQTLQVIVAPVPGQVLGGAAGYLFGAVPGALYSLLGVLVGSAVVFVLSQRYGRPFVERVIEESVLTRWDQFLANNGVTGLFVLFLLPAFPDDLLCFVAGASELRASTFCALVLVGRAPSFFAAAYAGTQLSNGHVLTAGLVVALLALVSLAVFGVRDRILGVLDRTF